MMFEMFQLVLLLADVAAFGYCLYLAGKAKGVLKVIEIVVKHSEKENETDA